MTRCDCGCVCVLQSVAAASVAAPAAAAALVTRRRRAMAHLPAVRATSGRPRLPPAHISRPVSLTSLQPLSRASSSGSRSDEDRVVPAGAPAAAAIQLPSKYEPLPAIPKRLVRQRTYEVIEPVVLKPGTPPNVGPEAAAARGDGSEAPPPPATATGGEGERTGAAAAGVSPGEQQGDGGSELVAQQEAIEDLTDPPETVEDGGGAGDGAGDSEEDVSDDEGDESDDGGDDGDGDESDAESQTLEASTEAGDGRTPSPSEAERPKLDIRDDSVEEVEATEGADLPTDSLEPLPEQEARRADQPPSSVPVSGAREKNYLKLNNYTTGEEDEGSGSDEQQGDDDTAADAVR